MDAGVGGKFGVKGRGQQVVLADGDGTAVGQGGQHVHAAAHADDDRGADKDGVIPGAAQAPDGQVLLKGVHLASEGVALDAYIHNAQGNGILFGDFRGQHNHTGAGAPDGFAGGGHCGHGFPQAVEGHQAAEGGAFAAGDDEAVQPVQMGGEAHFGGGDADAAEHVAMLRKVPLYRQNSDFQLRNVRLPDGPTADGPIADGLIADDGRVTDR